MSAYPNHIWGIDFALVAVDQALAQQRPQICNSDQRSRFISPQYIQRLLDANIHISMDSKGRALDNIFTERLRHTVKYEEGYLHDYFSPEAVASKWLPYLLNSARLPGTAGGLPF
ncbi:MAG: hypothetical protein R2867_29760 [Caldilineaceae bacterium]